jgi:hypothetical protein
MYLKKKIHTHIAGCLDKHHIHILKKEGRYKVYRATSHTKLSYNTPTHMFEIGLT